MSISVDLLSGDRLIQYFQQQEIEEEWSFIECKPSDTGKWTHDYHRYPAKFIPQLVEKLMDEYVHSDQAHINDPFMGCGTTIVSGIARGYQASGTDINGIAYLITKVKSTPIEPNYLKQRLDHFLYKLSAFNGNQRTFFDTHIEPVIPRHNLERIKYWFPDEMIEQLSIILGAIHQEEDVHIRDFLLVAFSHILKNCSYWLQGSTKPTRDLGKKIPNPFETIRRHLKKMQRGNEQFYAIVPKPVIDNLGNYLHIRIGDARHQPVADQTVDLIVSSSPYVTSYEYADLHQLSVLWLEIAQDLKDFKRNFIGTSYKKYADKRLKSSLAERIVREMEQKSYQMAKEIEAFFVDMDEVFEESYRILKPGGRCCYVIGDTKLKGVEIFNAEVFAESLQACGFRLDRVIKRRIPSKILPQKRDETTGRFASAKTANSEAYPIEYIVIGLKE